MHRQLEERGVWRDPDVSYLKSFRELFLHIRYGTVGRAVRTAHVRVVCGSTGAVRTVSGVRKRFPKALYYHHSAVITTTASADRQGMRTAERMKKQKPYN